MDDLIVGLGESEPRRVGNGLLVDGVFQRLPHARVVPHRALVDGVHDDDVVQSGEDVDLIPGLRLEFIRAQGIRLVQSRDIPGLDHGDGRHRIGDLLDNESVQAGHALAPVVLETFVDQLLLALEFGEHPGTGADGVKVGPILTVGLERLFGDHARGAVDVVHQDGIPTGEVELDGIVVNDLNVGYIAHQGRAGSEEIVQVPLGYLGIEIRPVVELDAFAEVEDIVGLVGRQLPARRQARQIDASFLIAGLDQALDRQAGIDVVVVDDVLGHADAIGGQGVVEGVDSALARALVGCGGRWLLTLGWLLSGRGLWSRRLKVRRFSQLWYAFAQPGILVARVGPAGGEEEGILEIGGRCRDEGAGPQRYKHDVVVGQLFHLGHQVDHLDWVFELQRLLDQVLEAFRPAHTREVDRRFGQGRDHSVQRVRRTAAHGVQADVTARERLKGHLVDGGARDRVEYQGDAHLGQLGLQGHVRVLRAVGVHDGCDFEPVAIASFRHQRLGFLGVVLAGRGPGIDYFTDAVDHLVDGGLESVSQGLGDRRFVNRVLERLSHLQVAPGRVGLGGVHGDQDVGRALGGNIPPAHGY